MTGVLRQNYPDAIIDLLVSERVYDLVFDYPNINKVHTIEKVTAGGIKRICRSGNYDLAIAVHPKLQIALGTFFGGVKNRLATGYRWYSFLFNLRHYEHRKEAIEHESIYNLHLLNELNCVYSKELKPQLNVKNEWVDQVWAKLSAIGVNKDNGILVIHIPSLGSAKVWSEKNFISLINLILRDDSIETNIILTGTKGDTEQVKRVAACLQGKDRVLAVLDLNLKELMALLSISRLVVSNSTGPIHIAAAVGAYVIGFYSSVKVESQVRWGPLTDKKTIFSPSEDTDSKDVMDDIKPEAVFEEVKKIMFNK
jgi:ADP-heptose:LPS heptosyltransferase